MSCADVLNLKGLSKKEHKEFINSFDTVLFDMDGVLWPLFEGPFPYTLAVLEKLQEVGKKLYFVTNNSLHLFSRFQETFKKMGFIVTQDMVISPLVAIIEYLKLIKFDKKIFAAASTVFRQALTDAGFSVIAPYDGIVEFSRDEMDKHLVKDPDIGLVIVGFHMNLSLYTAFNCITLLKNPEVLFMTTANENILMVGKETFFVGAGCIQASVSECAKRKPMTFGKPGKKLGDMVKQRFKITDPGRTLFIGDMLESDMAFASTCGFKKIPVMSGMTSWEEFQACEIKEQIPDYYMESIEDLLPILNNMEE